VDLPNGTRLEYDPIIYDGKHGYPSAPAGAETNVLGFRLSSARDRNGYLACFVYLEHNDLRRGQVADLSKIVYGLSPSQAKSCVAMLDDKKVRPDLSRHSIEFLYTDLESAGFFSTWTLRFGAPVSFKALLTRITTYAAGARSDTFCLDYDGQTSETRRPRLAKIRQVLPSSCEAGHNIEEALCRWNHVLISEHILRNPRHNDLFFPRVQEVVDTKNGYTN
jgi:hypothetical protein